MKIGTLALACMAGSVASVQQTTDIYYQDKKILDEERGGAMWTFHSNGVKIFTPDGNVLKETVSPMCGENGCGFFEYATDGHKYVWTGAFSPNRVEAYDMDTGDFVTYVPTCNTPLDMQYHPNTHEMWVKCAGNDPDTGVGHIDSFSTNTLHAEFEQIDLNFTSRSYGRLAVHSTLGVYGYSTVYRGPYLYKVDLATREVIKEIEMPLTYGGYDMTYSPVNKHVFLRTRVTCTCGTPDADTESCGRGGPSLVDVLTGPNAGAMQVNGTASSGCEGSKADTLGVYEFDTVTDTLVASHNIKEGTGFGADVASSPDGKYLVLMGNDGGQNIRVLKAGANGEASTIFADVPVDFQGGRPGQIVVSDYAFVTNNDKTILVVAASTDNEIALIDMDSTPLTMRKLALTPSSESTGGRSRAVEWAIGTDYVWINGADAEEMYIIEIPGGDITTARLVSTLSETASSQMMYVKNWQIDADRQFLKGVIDDYFEGDSPLSDDQTRRLIQSFS